MMRLLLLPCFLLLFVCCLLVHFLPHLHPVVTAPTPTSMLTQHDEPISTTPHDNPNRIPPYSVSNHPDHGMFTITSTAYGVAIVRYLATLGDISLPSALRLHGWDQYMLTSQDRHKLSTMSPLERYRLRKEMAPGNFASILSRTHHFTRTIQHLLTSHNITQLLILGAGYDTRCIQLSEWSYTSACYEMDIPSTQLIKKQRVAHLAHNPARHPLTNVTLRAIANTRYISLDMRICWDPEGTDDNVDVMCPSLTEALQTAGYDKHRPSIILLEGVVAYLSLRCFSSLLTYFHLHTCPSSYLLFDFTPDSTSCYGISHVAQVVHEMNEPIKFGMSPNRMKRYLHIHNWRVTEYLTPYDMEHQYLVHEGKSVGPVACYQHTISAINQ